MIIYLRTTKTNHENKRPSKTFTLTCSNNINNFFFDETILNFIRKKIRWLSICFNEISFHFVKLPSMFNPNVLFYRLCISRFVISDFWRSFLSNSWKIWMKSCTFGWIVTLLDLPANVTTFFWRSLLIGNFLSTFNNGRWILELYFIDPCRNFNIQENLSLYSH